MFTKANLAEGSIELTAYKMAYDALMTAMPTPVYLYNIYLTAEVNTLVERMQTRARDAERTEDDAAKESRRKYLEKLQDRHDHFFGLSAADLGVASYVGVRVNSELSADQVAQQAEYNLTRILAVCHVDKPAETPSKRVRPTEVQKVDPQGKQQWPTSVA